MSNDNSKLRLIWAGVIICVILLLDVMFLNYRLFLFNATDTEVQNNPQEDTQYSTTRPEVYNTRSQFELLEAKLQEATASISERLDTIEKVISQPVATPVGVGRTEIGVKEFYIPFGSGSTRSTEWSDLAGIEAYLAPSNYGEITGVYFEASLRIPTGTGKIYARLKNVTDGLGLFESEINHEGSTGKLISSGPIPIPQKTVLYRVQLKSSLGSEVVLDGGRLKVFVE